MPIPASSHLKTDVFSPSPTVNSGEGNHCYKQSIFHNRLNSLIKSRQSEQLFRSRRILQSPQSSQISQGEMSLTNFCSNDYLGLANDPRVKNACIQGVKQWGVGSGAAHLVCGHTHAHHALEEALADFLQRESVLLFSSGYAANVGVINGLLSQDDAIFQDSLNHASLLDGGWISRADCHRFTHNNVCELEEKLSANPIKKSDSLRMIASDGVFSMDGDTCNLNELVSVSKKHNAIVMIDDAHGIGSVGENAQGVVDPKTFSSADIPILVGTLGKAFGTSGAFVAGDKPLIEYLIQRARNYIYSTAMPSALAVAGKESLRIVQEEPWRQKKLSENIDYFKNSFFKKLSHRKNYTLLESNTAIQPIVIGSADKTLEISCRLENQGFLISAIRPPTVPAATSRLRITLTASHEKNDIDKLISALTVCGES